MAVQVEDTAAQDRARWAAHPPNSRFAFRPLPSLMLATYGAAGPGTGEGRALGSKGTVDMGQGPFGEADLSPYLLPAPAGGAVRQAMRPYGRYVRHGRLPLRRGGVVRQSDEAGRQTRRCDGASIEYRCYFALRTEAVKARHEFLSDMLPTARAGGFSGDVGGTPLR